jgi:hypothetical protein
VLSGYQKIFALEGVDDGINVVFDLFVDIARRLGPYRAGPHQLVFFRRCQRPTCAKTIAGLPLLLPAAFTLSITLQKERLRGYEKIAGKAAKSLCRNYHLTTVRCGFTSRFSSRVFYLISPSG